MSAMAEQDLPLNYDANEKHWAIGDLVIHDYDAKKPEMLMLVIGYKRNGECITRYLTPKALSAYVPDGKRYYNPVKYLHDPSRFNIPVRGK